MKKGKGLEVPATDIGALLDADSLKAKTAAWYAIKNRVLIQWDGKSDAFFQQMTPGLRAVVDAGEMHHLVEPDDLASFVSYRPDLAARMPEAFETLKADEYLNVFRQVVAKFPNKRFPEFAEDWLEAIEKVPLSFLKRMGKRLAAGKDMKRPLVDYVVDYVRANPKQFKVK
jgi:hypothetical protein